VRWEAARTALLRERLSARAAEAALLLSAEAGSVRVGATLRVTHYGGGDYEVRRAYQADAGGDAAVRGAVRDPLARPDSELAELTGAEPAAGADLKRGLRLIQGGQS
jgi:hypothetical protein